jgi:cytoskeletal protein CcmA (bactofilin family)
MWGRKDAVGTGGHVGAFLDEGSEMEGKYSCAGTVLIDARFRGEIVSKDTLIIGERGVVHADVHTARLVVRGEFVGNVTASDRVELKATARITGDIEAPIIVMEAGALHDGACRMAKAKSAETRLAESPLTLVVPMKA